MKVVLAEALGTGAIVFFGCGAILTGADRIGVNAVFGLVVFATVAALRPISGSHLNPAVTLAAWRFDGFPKRDVLPYLLAQSVGGILASVLHRLLLPDPGSYGATLPHIGPVPAALLESLMTATLVILAGLAPENAKPAVAGAVVALCGLFAGPLTGNSLNPARSLGPALLSGGPALAALPVYVLGPIAGALLGGAVVRALRP